jgi:hypothetical protein
MQCETDAAHSYVIDTAPHVDVESSIQNEIQNGVEGMGGLDLFCPSRHQCGVRLPSRLER